jgi:hypothetical protein
MENISKNFDILNLRLFIFDIKGSINNRREVIRKGKVLKCVNFVEINKSNKKLVKLDYQDIEAISNIVQEDSDFLERMGLIDYSLLLDVEQLTNNLYTEDRFNKLSRNEFKAYDNSKIYHIGIIDFL